MKKARDKRNVKEKKNKERNTRDVDDTRGIRH